jgi:hypothetical protein
MSIKNQILLHIGLAHEREKIVGSAFYLATRDRNFPCTGWLLLTECNLRLDLCALNPMA